MEKQKEARGAPVQINREKWTLASFGSKTQLLMLAAALFLLVCLLLARIGKQPDSLEKRLAAALSQLEGAGCVEVVIYQESRDASSDHASAVFSVLGTSSQQTTQPSGVLVLAQGADDLRVRLENARAVQALLGVPAANIEVLKKAD